MLMLKILHVDCVKRVFKTSCHSNSRNMSAQFIDMPLIVLFSCVQIASMLLKGSKHLGASEVAMHLHMPLVGGPVQGRAAVGVAAVDSRAGRQCGFQTAHVALAGQDMQAAGLLNAQRLTLAINKLLHGMHCRSTDNCFKIMHISLDLSQPTPQAAAELLHPMHAFSCSAGSCGRG